MTLEREHKNMKLVCHGRLNGVMLRLSFFVVLMKVVENQDHIIDHGGLM